MAEKYAHLLSYKRYWLEGISQSDVKDLGEATDSTVEYFMDSRNPQVINKLADYPIVAPLWIYRPAGKRWLGITMMAIFPIGLPIWVAGLRAQKDLLADCRTIADRSAQIMPLL